MRIRRRLVLLAVAVATAGMTLFAVLLSGLLARGVATDQDVALARLAAGTAAVVESVGPDGLASRQPLAPVDLATSTDPFVVVLDADGRPLYSTAAAAEGQPRVPAAVVVEAIETGSSVATIGQPPDAEFRVAAARWTYERRPRGSPSRASRRGSWSSRSPASGSSSSSRRSSRSSPWRS